jgi:hypothetical protein
LRALALLACIAVWGGVAQAQQITAISQGFSAQAEAVQESVNSQPREEYEPVGIRLGQFLSFWDTPFSAQTTPDPALARLRPGAVPEDSAMGLRDSLADSFLLQPSLEADLVFDDNLFRVDQNADAEQIYVLRPTLTLESDWLNHAFTAQAGGEFGRHQDFDGEDYDDYFISSGPRIDVDENTVLNLELGYSISHVARGSTDDELEGPEPSIDAALTAHADWQYQSDKYSTHLLYDFLQTDAKDNDTIERDFLDLRSHSWVFRQGYEFTTGTTAWLQPGLELVNYHQSRDDDDLVRDNQGWTLLAGLTIDRSAVSFLELGLGAMSRRFDQDTQDDFMDLVYQGRLLWNITSLFTLDVIAGRTAQVVESTVSPISVDDNISLELAWDPRENWIFGAKAAITHSEYETLPGQGLKEDTVDISFDVQYLMNTNLYFEARYEYAGKNSSSAGSDYQSKPLNSTRYCKAVGLIIIPTGRKRLYSCPVVWRARWWMSWI